MDRPFDDHVVQGSPGAGFTVIRVFSGFGDELRILQRFKKLPRRARDPAVRQAPWHGDERSYSASRNRALGQTNELLEQLDQLQARGEFQPRERNGTQLRVWSFIRSMLSYSFNVEARGLKRRMKAHREVIKEARLAEEI